MRSLPNGWGWAHFDDVATVDSNLVDPAGFGAMPHIAPNHIEGETGRLLAYRTVAEDGMTSAKHLFAPGHILYSKIRPYLAKAVVVNFAGLCSADMYPVSTPIDPRFLHRWLISREFTAMTSGRQGRTLLPKINRVGLGSLAVPIAPLAEQRRIVAAIEEQLSRLDAGQTSLVRAKRRLGALRDRALEPTSSGDWPWTTLGAIAEITGGITKDSKRQGDPSFVEVPYLRVANVQRGYLDLASVATIRLSPERAASLVLRRGDVLFNEGGDRDKLGRGWVWSGEIDGCIHQNHVFRARLHDGFEPRFVSWHGNTFGREWFETHGRQTTNLASLSLTTLKRFPVPNAPLDEQHRIVADIERQLSLVDALGAAIDRAQRRSAGLRRAILEKAFRGELVPQDPSDEPASALLERIRAARAAAPGAAGPATTGSS